MTIEDDINVIHGPEPSEPLPDVCLGKFVLQYLIDSPSDELMIDANTGEILTYKQFLQEICNLGESLRRYGCTSESLIALCSENHLKFYVPLLAAAVVGSIIVPINPAYMDIELEHVLNLTKPKIVFCSKYTVRKFIKNNFSFVEKIIVIDSNIPNVETMDNFVKKQLGGLSIDPQKLRIFDGDPATHVQAIMMSSGTTGLPKGVMLTDYSFEIRIMQMRDPTYLPQLDESGNYNPTYLGIMPFFHGAGMVLALAVIALQMKMVIMSRFDEDVFLKTIQDYKLQGVAVPPALIVLLAKSAKVDNYDLSSIKRMGSGAAPLNKEIQFLLKKRLPNIQSLVQGYGLTEYLAASLGAYKDKNKEGSAGRPATFTSIKIRDPETGRSLGPNQVGEICIKGSLVMKGYYKNEEATRESFTSDGWLKSGDLGYYDEDNFIFIVDRLKELIKYKGYQVSPVELEALLLRHPKVMDAGVIGTEDELAGEIPVAFVVKKPGVTVSEKELQDFVAGKVSPQKKLRGGVIFTSAIPKNQAGKILRREMKKMLKAYITKSKL